MTSRVRRSILLALAASLLLLAGCASAGSSSAAGGPPPPINSAGSPAAAGEPSTAAGSSSASAPPCTTHACVIEDAKSSLVGGVAKDESVMTALTCYSSTVKNPDPGIYTVQCRASYSDGSEWDGIASVLLSQSKVTWEPTEQLQ